MKENDPFDLQHLTTDELKAFWVESTKISRVRAQHGRDYVDERRKENAYWREWNKRIGERVRNTSKEPEETLGSTTQGSQIRWAIDRIIRIFGSSEFRQISVKTH